MAMRAAERALELDPSNAEALTAIGRALSNTYDWKGAKASFEQAYALEPNDVGVINLYGDFMGQIGEFDQGINLKRQAINLDPLSAVHPSDLALILSDAGRQDEAEIAARRGVALAPDSIQRITQLVEALILNGKYAEAGSEIEQVSQRLQSDPLLQLYLTRWQAMIYYRQDNTEKLRELVANEILASQNKTENYTPLEPSLIAFYVFCLDGPAAAIPWLQQAYNERDNVLVYPSVFYLPERLSDDPAWLEFWNRPVMKELLDLRRAHPYPSNGLWIAPEFPTG